MFEAKNLTKQQLLKTIEKLETNPNDRVGILADIGITTLGAAGAGAVAAVLGTTTASIPVITAVTGIGMVVAAPVGLVAGVAVVGGAAVYGISRLIKDGGYHDGKRKQLLNEYKERLREAEAKEKRASLDENDKTKFHIFLKEPLRLNLISAEDTQHLMRTVESGQMSLSDAYQLIGKVIAEARGVN